MATGGCLCGAVRYRVDGPLRQVIACHCEQCRKSSGHFVAATAAASQHLHIDDSAAALAWFRSSEFATRGFCNRCGSSLFWQRDGAQVTSIMAGTLDGDTGLSIDAHLFVGAKSDYYEITDVAKQFDADEPSGWSQERDT